MSVVRNEQAKLTATYLNNLAVALFAVGALTPVVSSLLSAAGATAFIVLIGAVCMIASLALHLLGRLVLKGLTP